MNIAVFSDKFSGTLSATEVLNIVKDKFLDSILMQTSLALPMVDRKVQEFLKVIIFKLMKILKL